MTFRSIWTSVGDCSVNLTPYIMVPATTKCHGTNRAHGMVPVLGFQGVKG